MTKKHVLHLQDWLIEQGRMEVLARSVIDPDYREKLYWGKDGQNNLM